jgi:hypothetical protein
MVLDARLKKLATGVSAKEAAAAHAKSLQPGAALDPRELTQAEEFRATLEAMFLMAAVDGEVSREELDQLAASVQAIADMHAIEGLRLTEMLDELAAKLGDEGWSARLDTVAARLGSPESRAFAFRLAAGVAFVDDHVAHAEAAAIDALAAKLGIDSDESQQILREVTDDLFGS